jgi:rare lipoprotein A
MRTHRNHSNTLVTLLFATVAMTMASCHNSAAPTTDQSGVASWYGHPFDGRPTASGEIFNMQKLTAAHRTLPLGTIVSVTSQVNGKVVQVKINDRGPFVQDRIIDLSYAAGQAIAMPGIANVSLHIVSKPATRAIENYAVQLGPYATRGEAGKVRAVAQNKYGPVQIVFRPGDETWRVLIGSEPSPESAQALSQKIDNSMGSRFVVLVDPDL